MARAIFSTNVELAFFRYSLEGLGRALYPILVVISIRRKQPDHLISATGGWTRDIAGSEIDCLSNVVFMLQCPLHTENIGLAPRSRCNNQ